MRNADEFNKRFGLGAQLQFKQMADGIVVAEIDNAKATAKISLHGGQIVSWQPKHQSVPVLWLSKLANFAPGKPIRGGVPICWPWFGAHPTNAGLPGHGYARIAEWELEQAEILSDGSVRIGLTMGENEASRETFTQLIRLSVQLVIGEELAIALTTSNKSERDIGLTEGLHTYFKVGDVRAIRVLGLEGDEYVDLICDNVRRTQEGPITFDGELGRIYVNSSTNCIVDDPNLRRRITVVKTGSQSTAVWNPWAQTASKMADLGSEGWKDMVCVESANALENIVTIKAGESHALTAVYSVSSIDL